MFCPNCGAKCGEDALFCESCGTSLAEAMQELTAQQQEQTNGNTEENGEAESAGAKQPAEAQTENAQAAFDQNQPQQNAGTEQPTWSGVQFGTPGTQGQPYGTQPMQGPQAVQPKQKKHIKIPKAVIAVIAAAVAALIAAAVFISVGISATDYKKTAGKFVKAYVSGDYEKAFGYLNLPESEFLSIDVFQQMNELAQKAEVSEVDVEDSYTARNSSVVKAVDVHYTLKSGGSDWVFLDMEKTDSNYLLFFKQYKVSATDAIAKDVLIRVPSGMKLAINGVEVSDRYLSETYKNKEDGNDYYQIPYLFQGDNQLRVTGDLIEDYEETFSVSYDEQSRYVGKGDLQFKEPVLNTLKEQAQKDLEKITAAGLGNKEFSEIQPLASASFQGKVESSYLSSVKKALHSSSREVTDLSLSNVKSSVKSKEYQITAEGIQYVKVTLAYTLNGKYKYNFDSAEREGKSNTTSASITYAYEDGKWGIAAMNLDFYIY